MNEFFLVGILIGLLVSPITTPILISLSQRDWKFKYYFSKRGREHLARRSERLKRMKQEKTHNINSLYKMDVK